MNTTLTIGMATYDDFDGTYFTVQALRVFHAEHLRDCELVVVDNNPGGAAGSAIKGLIEGWAKDYPCPARYVPFPDAVGTTQSRGRVFAESTKDAVLVVDCHVLLPTGTIGKLRRWYDEHPECLDLLTGPMYYDNLTSSVTHFDDVWRSEMWGTWGRAWRCVCGEFTFTVQEGDGRAIYRPIFPEHETDFRRQCPACKTDLPDLAYSGHEPALAAAGCVELSAGPENEAFEIPANGLGLFTCRRDSWLGFNPHFRGFGGEEFYIHHKYRQAGRKCLSLPFLKWLHRFGRPAGVPYPLTRWNKVRNYVLGHVELGLSLDRVRAHFVDSGLMPAAQWEWLIADPVAHVEPGPPPPRAQAGCGGCNQPQQNTATLDELFDQAVRTPADMHEHLLKLRELSSQCGHVTAFVHPGVATLALLAGQPHKLNAYCAVGDHKLANLLAKRGKTVVVPNVANTLTMPLIEETDLLFIDTKHTADHLWGELRHAERVRRWIVLHDTQIYGERGEDGGPGLLPALRRFMRERPEWSVVYHATNNYGLTVLSRDPVDKPDLPSLARQAWNYSKAMLKHAAQGKPICTEEQFEARMNICLLCEQRTDNRCAVCGCYLDEGPGGREGKAVWRDSECPLGRWPKPEEETPATKPPCVCPHCVYAWDCGTMPVVCPYCGKEIAAKPEGQPEESA